VPSCKSHFVSEDKVGANKWSIAHAQTCWKAFVVRVAKTKNCATIIRIGTCVFDVKETEVTLTESVKRMVSVNNFPTIVLDLVLHTINKERMTDWLPRLSLFGSLYGLYFAKVNSFCATYGEINFFIHNF
jgi:hypothetical protein